MELSWSGDGVELELDKKTKAFNLGPNIPLDIM